MARRLLIRSRVVAIERLEPRVVTMETEPVHRDAYPPFPAGASCLVRLPNGLLRSYSICSDGDHLARYRFAVLQEADGRGGSAFVHESLAVGDLLHVSYPQPGMSIAAGARRHVMIAGGIGITPFPSLVREARKSGASVELHYAVRDTAPLLAQLREILRDDLHVYDARLGDRLDLAALVGTVGSDAALYYCASTRLAEAIRSAANAAGISDEQVHGESFGGLTQESAAVGEPFVAELALTGRDVEVSEGQTLLQALLAADVPVDSSCEGGVCGACRVELLAGEAIHRDRALSPADRTRTIISCVSRGVGRITLNL